jgi:hypothetical protein
MATIKTSNEVLAKQDLEVVADHLGDTAQSLVWLIEGFDAAGPEIRTRRCTLVAARLRMLAESLTPQDNSSLSNSVAESALQLSEDLLTLAGEAERIVHRAVKADGLLERSRVAIICAVSQLRLVITILANQLSPETDIVRLMDFPIEA